MDDIKDEYYSITTKSEGLYKEKGSKFIAYAYPVTDEDAINHALEEVRGLHPKARHHCYAYRLGIHGEPHRANDDGEPSGTAGRPILGQLKSHDLSDVLVIVVRYFGGTLLGASGLIHAYKESTNDALIHNKRLKKVITVTYRLDFTYAEMGHVMNIIKQHGINIIDKNFEATPSVDISIRKSKEENEIIALKADLLQITKDQVTMETEIDFCAFNKIS